MAKIQLTVILPDELLPCSASLFADSGVWSPVSPPRKGARYGKALLYVFHLGRGWANPLDHPSRCHNR
jgi:hypothetical protein